MDANSKIIVQNSKIFFFFLDFEINLGSVSVNSFKLIRSKYE